MKRLLSAALMAAFLCSPAWAQTADVLDADKSPAWSTGLKAPLSVTPGQRLRVDDGGTSATGVRVTFNRTADTNAYNANDVIGTATGSTAALTFANIAASAREVMLTSATLEVDLSAVTSGMTSFNLYCYNVTPPSALGDNAAFDIPSGDRASLLFKVSLGAPADEGSTLYVQTDSINKQFTPASTSLYCYLVTVGAYTPASGTTYVVTLHFLPL